MLRLLILFVISCCIVSSCGQKLTKHFTTIAETPQNLKPLFHPEHKEHVFDLAISHGKGNQNSGVLAVVRDSLIKSNYRTVFMTKTGQKLFDFSFTAEKMTVNHIIPQMDKKIIKNILKADLRLFLDDIHLLDPPIEELSNPDKETKLVRFKKKRRHYRVSATPTGQIVKVEKGKKNRSFVTMEISYLETESPKEIFIKHHRLPFSMRLISLSSN